MEAILSVVGAAAVFVAVVVYQRLSDRRFDSHIQSLQVPFAHLDKELHELREVVSDLEVTIDALDAISSDVKQSPRSMAASRDFRPGSVPQIATGLRPGILSPFIGKPEPGRRDRAQRQPHEFVVWKDSRLVAVDVSEDEVVEFWRLLEYRRMHYTLSAPRSTTDAEPFSVTALDDWLPGRV